MVCVCAQDLHGWGDKSHHWECPVRHGVAAPFLARGRHHRGPVALHVLLAQSDVTAPERSRQACLLRQPRTCTPALDGGIVPATLAWFRSLEWGNWLRRDLIGRPQTPMRVGEKTRALPQLIGKNRSSMRSPGPQESIKAPMAPV